MDNKEGSNNVDRPIVSFSCAGTYDLVVETNVHAHPIKAGFPSRVLPFLMVRANGGLSDALYEVVDTIDLNPMDDEEVSSLLSQYSVVAEYIYKRRESFGFKNAPLPYRFYLLRKVYDFIPGYVMKPNPQGHKYLSFEDVGISSEEAVTLREQRVLTSDSFIDSLALPWGVEAKRFEGMNRVHFKYNGHGFALIDMKSTCYNVASREEYMLAIGVENYEITRNLGPNKALIKDVPYSDTGIISKLISYIIDESNYPDGLEQQELEREEQCIEKEITETNLVGLDRIAIIKARVNQGVFRDRLIRKYHKCCICGVDDDHLLIASHIKPWIDSNNKERVDENNGLLLCPNHDRLFDQGFITFDDSGKIMISQSLSVNNRILLNVNPSFNIKVDSLNRDYMKYHRENIFLGRTDEAYKSMNDGGGSDVRTN